MSSSRANASIAKNTVFLYVRMLIIMLVTLYTSRVILQALGVDDYGLYQAVGGVVGFLAFISTALSTASSRFITFALGKGDKTELENTFATTLTTQLLIGVFIVLLAETVGLWYVNNKMVIPDDRFDVLLAVFHISILTAFITILQVPFSSEVIAHEKMSVFAYLGIIEAIGKLVIIYLITVGGIDRLVMYALLLFMVHLLIFFFYVVFSRKFFSEVIFRLSFDKKLFREIFTFSGWSLFASGAIALSNHGILLLLNLFFAPAVVAARSISLTVSNTASQFVQNFRTAANPQIIKRYAAGDFHGSKTLLLDSTKFSYYLMLLIALPLILLAEPILNIWLVEVPNYTVIFLQIVVVQSLFQVFDTSFYTALYAKGRMKENALISPTLGFLCFPIVYILFRVGYSPVALSWAYLFQYALLGLLVKPILLNRICDYNWREIFDVFKICSIVTVVSVPVPLLVYLRIGASSMTAGLFVLLISIMSVSAAVWTVGLTSSMRTRLVGAIKIKLHRNFR